MQMGLQYINFSATSTLEPLYNLSNVDIAVDYFYKSIYSVIDICVPRSAQFLRNYPPWFSKDIIKI